MPRVSRWFVKSALGYLVVGLVLAVALHAGFFEANRMAARTTQIHLITLGWLTQLIFGIGYWLLPLHPIRRDRGPVLPIWISYFCLNTGLPLRTICEIGNFPLGLWIAGTVLLVGSLAFTTIAWPRAR